MARTLKAAGTMLVVGMAVSAVFFCLGDAGARTAPEQAAVQQRAEAAQNTEQALAQDGPVLLFPDLDMNAITAISVFSPERSFQFYADGSGKVSVNGQQADAEIYLTLVNQISELPVHQTEAFIPDSVQWLLTLTVCTGGKQHIARFYEDDSAGKVARIVTGSADAPEYGQTGGWRVGTLMMTCEGTRIQDERGNERPASLSSSAPDPP